MKWFVRLALVAFMGLAVYGTLAQTGTLTKLAEIVRTLKAQLADMDPMVASWTDADGVTHTVTTHHNGTETIQEWIDRHKDKVDKMKVAFPPVE